jgi:hypothetical protein
MYVRPFRSGMRECATFANGKMPPLATLRTPDY